MVMDLIARLGVHVHKVNRAYRAFCCNHPCDNFIFETASDQPLQIGARHCLLSKTDFRFAVANMVMDLIARLGFMCIWSI